MTNIAVTLETHIRDGAESERMSLTEKGRFFRKGDMDVVTFREHPEDRDPVDTMVTIKPGHVSIKRSGGVEMRQLFEPQAETQNAYVHEYGKLFMTTWTENLEYQAPGENESGELFIEYQLTVNDDVTQKHQLKLTLEEDSE
ncbi:DUF1934 domain-containing protein [Salimicrobium flavidum]|uniref:Uncharacterized beta-barrel protein YwiB, DUF1934 family n=1 Tax=Salimicrobium flavidum TaxID=570947 RepID=A0A1N7IVI9_9BACI|nr:DUF1934 domain-containing protein [Salimicrobium flavidum]SIS41036.1 Uncharacterized beta-barrel protein YwiB, DUF1934 family [Salimicrobium flavidum]